MEADSDAETTVDHCIRGLACARTSFQGLAPGAQRDNYFKSACWSPDGTCIVSNSADNHIRTFIVPPNLLESKKQQTLAAYSSIPSFEAVNALVCYPGFDLQNPATALILSTASEHPIRLNSVLDGSLVASYPLVSPTTEAYIKPHSLLFEQDGGHFVAGSNSQISFFDTSRVGEPPTITLKTGPKSSRSRWDNPGTALAGLISALALDGQYNTLAAGTLSRQIGLYDAGGKGECVGVFSTIGTEADKTVSGAGITQLLWSRCGRYLYIVERKSNGCLVYDIRKTGQLLSWATGRRALTNQRMSVDLPFDHHKGAENLWAGGTDGAVRCWEELSAQEGAAEPTYEYFLHADVVNSVSFHTTAPVVATAAGQWDPAPIDTTSDSLDELDSGCNLLLLSKSCKFDSRTLTEIEQCNS